MNLGAVYIFDVAHDDILETIFPREYLHYDELML